MWCCTVRLDPSGIHLSRWAPFRSRHIAFQAVEKVSRYEGSVSIRTNDGATIDLIAIGVHGEVQKVLKRLERAIVDAVRAETGRDVSHVSYHLQRLDDRFRADDDDD